MNTLQSIGLEWIWMIPMAGLSCLMCCALVDGLLFMPCDEEKFYRPKEEILDVRIAILAEVQRCSVIVGFLGTLVGTYQVLESLGRDRSAESFHAMFSGVATAVTSSIIGCLLFLVAIAGDRLVRLRWSMARKLWKNHWYFKRDSIEVQPHV